MEEVRGKGVTGSRLRCPDIPGTPPRSLNVNISRTTRYYFREGRLFTGTPYTTRTKQVGTRRTYNKYDTYLYTRIGKVPICTKLSYNVDTVDSPQCPGPSDETVGTHCGDRES